MRQPDGMNGFEFVVVSSLRAAQLIRGCTARVDTDGHKLIVTAQREVAEGFIVGAHVLPGTPVPVPQTVVEIEPEPALVAP